MAIVRHGRKGRVSTESDKAVTMAVVRAEVAIPEQAALSAQVMPDILYIMGTARSGTTILEIILANNPGITGVGEFKHVFSHAFLENRICSCGKAALECDRWVGVLNATSWDSADCGRMHRVLTSVEGHARFPLVWAGLVRGQKMRTYRQALEGLFKSIALLSRCVVIADSSKYESRALMLARLFPEKVKVLCLTRSAAGLIATFRKKNAKEQSYPKSLLWIAGYYGYVLLCMWAVKAKLKERCLSVRFEDLMHNPGEVLNSIEAWSGYSLSVARTKLAEGGRFTVGHIVSGNRVRLKGEVRFESVAVEPALQGAGRGLAKVLEAYRRRLGF